MSDIAEQVLDAVNKGFYKEATQLWGKAEMIIEKVGSELGLWGHGFSPGWEARVGKWDPWLML